MTDDTHPRPATGAALVAIRTSAGVAQQDVARALGMHRITLWRIEGRDMVPAVIAARYERAVRELVREAVA